MNMYDIIEKERAKAGLSRRELAKKAGIPTSTFQSIMERKRNITVECLEKLSVALNVDIITFFL